MPTHPSTILATVAILALGCSPHPTQPSPTGSANQSLPAPSDLSTVSERNTHNDHAPWERIPEDQATGDKTRRNDNPDGNDPTKNFPDKHVTAHPTQHSGSLTKPVRMIAWNVESGGNDPAIIATQLSAFQGCDVICLSEVNDANFERYASALDDQYHEVHGNTGRSDRLQILVRRDRYDVLEHTELSQYREHTLNKGNHRSPLFVRIKNRNSGTEMIVMTNHLARGNAEFRQDQAVGLREWARDQNVPVIALGDFNMDYDYRRMKGNAAFDEMVRDNVWTWLAPHDFIDTNWSDRDGDGNDNYPDSMLDLAFAAGAAKEWGIECRVIVRPDDFPDDKSTSDHRPIELVFGR
jgi:endonuclease/exonuclease/phosphatase family metal-dependent hydrolase